MSTYVVGISGASGSIYAFRLIHELLNRGHRVHVIPSETALQVMEAELALKNLESPGALEEALKGSDSRGLVSVWSPRDFQAPFASGSSPPDAVIVVPCSMGTLAGIAAGDSGNLLRRSADVALKEGRRLLLVPRETPLNAIHLENMLKLARLGVTILPAMPGFYHRPTTVEDVVDFVVGRILDQLNIPHELITRWGEH